jgi:GABA permease
MNNLEHSEQRILVIANRTCPCDTLADEVASRARDASADVLVVAPALNSLLRHLASDADAAVIQAQERVNRAVAQMRNRGLSVRGHVGDTNPMLAIEDALAEFWATEILIATHPPGQSHWLERRLIEKARARFDVPVIHIVSSHGVEEAADAATRIAA